MLLESPNLGIIYLSRHYSISVVFLVLVEYASIRPEKVSMKTNKNVTFPMVLSKCVKSICQFSNGHIPLYHTPFLLGYILFQDFFFLFCTALTGLDKLRNDPLYIGALKMWFIEVC